MKIIVIGAGASGIIASLKASEKNEVILIDGNDKIGKKILLTGNGHCNYWNSDINIKNYNTDNENRLESILSYQNEVLTYLNNLGIYPVIKNGYYYPYSKEARSIQKIFNDSLKNVNLVLNTRVIDVIKENNKFKVITDNNTYYADKVIMAMGSKAYPKTGSDGSCYHILSKYHKINKVMPALCGLCTDSPYLKDWNGIRIEAKVSLIVDNKILREETGELQLTDYGISGICVFNLSSLANKYIDKNPLVEINFLSEDFKLFLENRSRLNMNLDTLLSSIFPYKLLNIFFNLSKINRYKKYQELTKKEIDDLCNLVNHYKCHIISSNSFDRSQVCTGGLSLNDVNDYLESNKVKGLYIVGETLDVDGICGGFNLAFAFITGFIAGSDCCVNDKD